MALSSVIVDPAVFVFGQHERYSAILTHPDLPRSRNEDGETGPSTTVVDRAGSLRVTSEPGSGRPVHPD
jgi:hypothetical protein